MITHIPANSRGRTELPWLASRHSFSFGSYHDPANTGFGALRVINDDQVAPGAGFGAHGHRDMEIITYVTSGALEHQDSLGNRTILPAGEVQRMTAGTGIVHSEYNASQTVPVEFLQIWIEPDRKGHVPGHEQMAVPVRSAAQPFVKLASPNADPEALLIHQDATIWLGRLDEGASEALPVRPGRRAWLHLVRGRLAMGGKMYEPGDAAAIDAYGGETLEAQSEAEVLIFEV
jgi:quercetin 2,3-dioxygenase